VTLTTLINDDDDEEEEVQVRTWMMFLNKDDFKIRKHPRPLNATDGEDASGADSTVQSMHNSLGMKANGDRTSSDLSLRLTPGSKSSILSSFKMTPKSSKDSNKNSKLQGDDSDDELKYFN